MPSFEVRNFGCRTNQADGAEIARQLRSAGLTPLAGGAADLVVLNTCTVTAAADADARAALRRLAREQPRSRILVTGCYAERAPQELRALGAHWVVGHGGKSRIGALVRGAPLLAPESLGATPLAHSDLALGEIARTRPNVKVQDGCGNRCSFCVIPAVRGASRSLPVDEVVDAVARHADTGVAEVVLTGINLGQWGRDLSPRSRFVELVSALLRRTAIPRMRLSSIEPMDWSAELIALLALEPRLAPHAHVPLQSGSDTVLRRMRRRYRPWHYAEQVRRIRERLPEAAIGADVMVGFPGESDAEYAETCRFIAASPLTYLHVFTYSPRPGTEATRRAGETGWEPVSPAVAAERSRRLHAIGAARRTAFARQFAGRELEVVTLEDGRALSGNFLPVLVPGRAANRLLRVRIEEAGQIPLLAASI